MKNFLMKHKKFLKYASVLFYGIVTLSILSVVHTWHFLDLKPDTKIPAEIALLSEGGKHEKYNILHVLGEGCGCSEFTAEYLYNRGAQKGIKEIIYYLGDKDKIKFDFTKKGYIVHFKSLEELENQKKKISGVPLFQIYNQEKELLYSGGYSSNMVTRGTKFLDLNTLDKIVKDGFAKANPILGCAVGKAFMSMVDPLGLKY